ncbi:MAG: 50S ribosomal protein L18 [Patescibacteria group bacterium]|nr:50S ribosomal protein L18 [Patescibacteria group bacterium]
MNTKIQRRKVRKKRIRSKIFGTAKRPRMSVFRSNRGMNVQLIDDQNQVTLISVNHKAIDAKGTKIEQSFKLGEKIAEMAKERNINCVVFDRGGYRFHGRVKAVAEGARKGGLSF